MSCEHVDKLFRLIRHVVPGDGIPWMISATNAPHDCSVANKCHTNMANIMAVMPREISWQDTRLIGVLCDAPTATVDYFIGNFSRNHI